MSREEEWAEGFICLVLSSFFFTSLTSEREAERIRERLAQEEAEAMEMEDEERKIERMLEKVGEYWTCMI